MTDGEPGPAITSLQIADADFVVCDVETTGLSPFANRITEIALVRVCDGEIVDKFETLVNPRQFIPREITDLTGITNEMVYDAPDFAEIAPRVKEFIEGTVFVAHNASFDRGFVDQSFERCGMPHMEVPVLCTARMARRLMPSRGSKSLRSIAHQLGIRNPASHRAGGDAETTARVLLHFFEILDERFEISEVGELVAFQYKPVSSVVTPPKNILRIKDQLPELPYSPGVYFFHDKKGNILYIGKAKELHERVQSYFTFNIGHTEKVRKLVRQVHTITWKTTETELSALLLESHSIKEHQPPFNSALKRVRRFPFIRIDARDAFPTVSWCYEIDEDGCEFYGPFSSRYVVETAIESIGRLFHLRKCTNGLKPSADKPPCIYHSMHQCAAPCAGLQSPDEYAREIDTVRRFLSGRHEDVLEVLSARMAAKADALEFEAAAELRDRIFTLNRLIRQQQVMLRSVHEQELVVLTPARRRCVEVHLIHGGRLAAQFIVNQDNADRRELRRALKHVFFSGQTEMFNGTREDINDMRIIASWCMTKRNESAVIDVNGTADAKALETLVINELEGMK
jgi:DNA polymerase-3 subunit epsilon